MGYYYSSKASKIDLRSNPDGAFVHIRRAAIEAKIDGNLYEFQKANNFEDLLKSFGFSPVNNSGRLVGIRILRQKLAEECDEIFFKALAKHADGFVECMGDDGKQWRYVMEKGKFEVHYPLKVIWGPLPKK